MKRHDAPRNAVGRDRCTPASGQDVDPDQPRITAPANVSRFLSSGTFHNRRIPASEPRPSCPGSVRTTSSAAPLVMVGKRRHTRPSPPLSRTTERRPNPCRSRSLSVVQSHAQGSVDVQPTRHLGRPPGHPSPIGQYAQTVRPRIDTTSQGSYIHRVVTRRLGRIDGPGGPRIATATRGQRRADQVARGAGVDQMWTRGRNGNAWEEDVDGGLSVLRETGRGVPDVEQDPGALPHRPAPRRRGRALLRRGQRSTCAREHSARCRRTPSPPGLNAAPGQGRRFPDHAARRQAAGRYPASTVFPADSPARVAPEPDSRPTYKAQRAGTDTDRLLE